MSPRLKVARKRRKTFAVGAPPIPESAVPERRLTQYRTRVAVVLTTAWELAQQLSMRSTGNAFTPGSDPLMNFMFTQEFIPPEGPEPEDAATLLARLKDDGTLALINDLYAAQYLETQRTLRAQFMG